MQAVGLADRYSELAHQQSFSNGSDSEVFMPVPEYQTFMAPALRALEDGQQRSMKEIRERVGNEMDITEEDKQQTIQSGVSVFR